MLTSFLQALLAKKQNLKKNPFVQVKIENATKYLENLIRNVGLLTKVYSELVVEAVLPPQCILGNKASQDSFTQKPLTQYMSLP